MSKWFNLSKGAIVLPVILESSQQPRLRNLVKISELVELQRSSVYLVEGPRGVPIRSSERSFVVTEELTGAQITGEVGAVNPLERLTGSSRGVVDESGQFLLTSTGLTQDQDGFSLLPPSDVPSLPEDPQHLRIVRDQTIGNPQRNTDLLWGRPAPL